ncbi:hypothetical protein CEXT_441921 [Caerostris extrusa]|uniref:Uncharacterized protein n=1 Tax=Caerostris extrusa TaxID=172846 RepID=A0AAV4Y432_CAEEX|nr:hypothetical protein CEXT_441921 [Caerostris extrusa]
MFNIVCHNSIGSTLLSARFRSLASSLPYPLPSTTLPGTLKALRRLVIKCEKSCSQKRAPRLWCRADDKLLATGRLGDISPSGNPGRVMVTASERRLESVPQKKKKRKKGPEWDQQRLQIASYAMLPKDEIAYKK